MIGLFEALSRPLLRQLDAEDAHRLAILGLRFAPIFPRARDDASLAVRAFGIELPQQRPRQRFEQSDHKRSSGNMCRPSSPSGSGLTHRTASGVNTP